MPLSSVGATKKGLATSEVRRQQVNRGSLQSAASSMTKSGQGAPLKLLPPTHNERATVVPVHERGDLSSLFSAVEAGQERQQAASAPERHRLQHNVSKHAAVPTSSALPKHSAVYGRANHVNHCGVVNSKIHRQFNRRPNIRTSRQSQSAMPKHTATEGGPIMPSPCHHTSASGH